jgi:hypothetical protein
MIAPPSQMGTFEFVVLASLRAAQLSRGCSAKVNGLHKVTVLAQLEVSEGKVGALFSAGDALLSETEVSSIAWPVMSPVEPKAEVSIEEL